jgi:hypothetical protein
MVGRRCHLLQVTATMQVYDTAEWFTGRLYSILMIMMRMYATDVIAIQSVDDYCMYVPTFLMMMGELYRHSRMLIILMTSV